MNQALVHIGYHKTGTSFLQEAVFERYRDSFVRVPQREIYEKLIYPDPLEFDEQEAKAYVDSYIQRALEDNALAVFSNERLSGSLNTGGYDSAEIAHRLKRCMPDARILIVIREQKDIIYSAYSQYLKGVGSSSLKEFMFPSTPHNKTLFHFRYLEYHKLIELYYDLFGKSDVLVLPYELLVQDADAFIDKVLRFIGVDAALDKGKVERKAVNTSLQPLQVAVKRFFNPFIIKGHPFLGTTLYSGFMHFVSRSVLYTLGKMKLKRINARIKSRHKDFIRKSVEGKYALSNRKTQELIGFELEEFGYEMGSGNEQK